MPDKPSMNIDIGRFKDIVSKQREINDQQVSVRRATWDQYLDTVSEPGEMQDLLKQLASNAAAW